MLHSVLSACNYSLGDDVYSVSYDRLMENDPLLACSGTHVHGCLMSIMAFFSTIGEFRAV